MLGSIVAHWGFTGFRIYGLRFGCGALLSRVELSPKTSTTFMSKNVRFLCCVRILSWTLIDGNHCWDCYLDSQLMCCDFGRLDICICSSIRMFSSSAEIGREGKRNLASLSSNLVEIPIYGILTVRDADKGHESLRKPHD